MLFRKVESTITKVVKVKDRSSIGDRNYFTNDELQKILRTTYWFLFIPMYTYDKRI